MRRESTSTGNDSTKAIAKPLNEMTSTAGTAHTISASTAPIATTIRFRKVLEIGIWVGRRTGQLATGFRYTLVTTSYDPATRAYTISPPHLGPVIPHPRISSP